MHPLPALSNMPDPPGYCTKCMSDWGTYHALMEHKRHSTNHPHFCRRCKVEFPTDDELSELFLSCRYGDLEDVQQFIAKYGSGADSALVTARDDNGNTVLHMCCANGHLGMFICSAHVFMGQSLISETKVIR